MSRLRVLTPSAEPFVHSFDGESLVIGRSLESDLPHADRFLSRQHARLFRDGDRILVEDLGSHNGTFLNDQRVEAATEVRPGDVIKLSGTVLTILGESRSTPTSAATDTLFRRADEILENSSTGSAAPPLEENEKLRTYAQRLRLLNDVHRALARHMGLEQLLELTLERIFDHLEPEKGAVFLLEGDGEPYRAASRSVSGEELLYSRSLIREVIEKGVAALVHDARSDSRFAGAESILGSGVRSILAAPLLDPDGVEGMIVLRSRLQVREFHEEDMELLVSLAAGLIEVGEPPEQICTLASRQLHARTPPEKYATAFVAALDFASGSLRYCNAGHNAALLVRATGEVEELAATGPPVGLLPGAEYAGADALLEPGDLLVAYTDGITEATNPEDEEYGIERLAEQCAAHRDEPLADFAHRLDSDLEDFASGVPFADDRTLVLIRRTSA